MTRDNRTEDGGTDRADDQDESGLSRRGILRGSAALGAAPVIASAAGAAEAAIGDGPQGVHVAYGQEPTSMLTVAFSGAPGGGTVRYGEAGDDPETADLDTTVGASGWPVPGRDAMAYTATLTGLAADTAYAYEVELGGTTGERRTVRTAPLGDGSDGFTITQVGDNGIADPENPGQRPGDDNPNMVLRLAEQQEPVMQLLSGDISYSNGKPSTWELYFGTHEDYLSETPFMTVPGNHEAEVGTGMVQYDRRLNDAMPIEDPGIDAVSKRRWWDIVYENTFIMGLNTTADACGDMARAEELIPIYDPRCETEQGLTYGEIQEEYMRSALARAEARDDVKWKIVTFHGPLWTTSPDHEPRRDLQERWGPIFDEYDVDLVLHGDNHVWERSKPITHTEDLLTYSERREPRQQGEAPPPEAAAEGLDLPFEDSNVGTTFVVNGTGGVSHYELGARELYIDTAFEDFFGVTRLDIDDESITVQYVSHPPLQDVYGDGTLPDEFDPSLSNPDIEVRDAFEIRKTPDGRPKQVQTGGVPDEPTGAALSVSGERTDDGDVFRAGATNQIDLSVEANDAVELRDRIPIGWDVIGGDVGRTEPGPDDTQYVYLEMTPSEEVETSYFVEAPGDADDTGQYSFGPVEARGTERFAGEGWQAVPGTTSTEYVIAAGTGAGLPL
jgi:hypothetical protein